MYCNQYEHLAQIFGTTADAMSGSHFGAWLDAATSVDAAGRPQLCTHLEESMTSGTRYKVKEAVRVRPKGVPPSGWRAEDDRFFEYERTFSHLLPPSDAF